MHILLKSRPSSNNCYPAVGKNKSLSVCWENAKCAYRFIIRRPGPFAIVLARLKRTTGDTIVQIVLGTEKQLIFFTKRLWKYKTFLISRTWLSQRVNVISISSRQSVNPIKIYFISLLYNYIILCLFDGLIYEGNKFIANIIK
jgi:hypothetical protein